MSNNKSEVDSVLGLWLIANTKKEQAGTVKGFLGQFDIETPMSGGVLKSDETGQEVPFFCIRVQMKVLTAQGVEAGMAIVTTFKYNGQWVTTLMPGTKPSFSLEKYAHPIPEMLSGLMKGTPINNPGLYMEMV